MTYFLLIRDKVDIEPDDYHGNLQDPNTFYKETTHEQRSFATQQAKNNTHA